MDRAAAHFWRRWMLPVLGLWALGLLWLPSVTVPHKGAESSAGVVLAEALSPIDEPAAGTPSSSPPASLVQPSTLILSSPPRCLPALDSGLLFTLSGERPPAQGAQQNANPAPPAAEPTAPAAAAAGSEDRPKDAELAASGPKLSADADSVAVGEDQSPTARETEKPAPAPPARLEPSPPARRDVSAAFPTEAAPAVPRETSLTKPTEMMPEKPRPAASSSAVPPAPLAGKNAVAAGTPSPPSPGAVEKLPAASNSPAAVLAPGQTTTPWVGARPANVSRSAQLEAIAQEADQHTQKAFELAGRNAPFAARAELFTALRLVAQGLDAERQTSMHCRALAAGSSALQEAEDFLPRGTQLEADLDLRSIIGGHRTPVLRAAPTVTPLEAIKCYLTFAQEQLAAAAGGEFAGSVALQGLGKLYSTLSASPSITVKMPEAKAMAFYQAALLVAPRNYMAANDLGVLLARHGRYAEARGALEHSVSLKPQAAIWHNLAVVYRSLGETDRAQRAEILAASGDSTRSATVVRWVDPQAFADSSAAGAEAFPPAGITAAAPRLNNLR